MVERLSVVEQASPGEPSSRPPQPACDVACGMPDQDLRLATAAVAGFAVRGWYRSVEFLGLSGCGPLGSRDLQTLLLTFGLLGSTAVVTVPEPKVKISEKVLIPLWISPLETFQRHPTVGGWCLS